MAINWKSLKIVETLNIDWYIKYIALLVKVSSDAHAEEELSIILAQRQGFDDADDFLVLLSPGNLPASELYLIEQNDIYYRYSLLRGSRSECAIQVIHPATSAHIAKYRRQDRILHLETPDQYKQVTLPFIERQATHRIKWIENILAGISEQDRIIINYHPNDDDAFIVLPDHKWDQKSMSSMYLLAIAKRRDIRSLRDLTSKHLPLLKTLCRVIRERLPQIFPAINANQIRLYFHYLPTYFYFHLHIVHMDYETPGCAIGAAHMLEDIIDNIETFGDDYYQRRTLPILLGKQHELYPLLYKSD